MKRAAGSSQVLSTRPVKKAKYGKAKRKPGSTARRLTLSRQPFPLTVTKKLTYTISPQLITTAANFSVQLVRANDMFDFDYSNNLGNKQPMYFDTMFTATGPYRQFLVKSWTTKWTIQNGSTTTPMNVFILPTHSDVAALDSTVECEDYPGVIKKTLLFNGDSESLWSCTVSGKPSDVFGDSVGDDVFRGSYNASPSTILYGGVALANANTGITTQAYYLGVEHTFTVECLAIDSIAS